MNRRIVYHGSKDIIPSPTFGGGKERNDYGRGFYTTESLDLAKEWAVSKDCDGYANKYELDTTSLTIRNLNSPKHNGSHWIAILLQNRTFSLDTPLQKTAYRYLTDHFLIPNYRDYDIIEGYRADDSYFGFASAFLNGAYSVRQLSYALKLGHLGTQIVLISKKALSCLKFIDSIPAKKEDYLAKKLRRDKEARDSFFKSKKAAYDPNDIYITDIIRGGIEDGDRRLW